MFPFISQKPANSVAEWETASGGGVRAVGAGCGVTGYGAGLIVIDDPVKSRAEAESETYRARVWDWFNDDLYTRLEPNGAIILIQTRWHEDDLAGRLLAEMKNGGEQWEVVSLPALAEAGEVRNADCGLRIQSDEAASVDPITNITQHRETKNPIFSTNPQSAIRDPQSNDPLGRKPGEALCPERFDEAELARIRAKLGSYSFNALYQQNPMPPEGTKFKRSWFKRIIDEAPPNLRWCRGYDLAVSTKTSADYTASFRVAKDKHGNIYIADGFRGRLEFPEQRRYIIGRIRDEKNTSHGIEAALHGRAIVQELRRDARLCGRPFRSVDVDTDTLTRALSWANVAEEGKIHLVRGPWIEEFLDEVIRFPAGRHDDQIDAVSIAVRMLSETGFKAAGF